MIAELTVDNSLEKKSRVYGGYNYHIQGDYKPTNIPREPHGIYLVELLDKIHLRPNMCYASPQICLTEKMMHTSPNMI